jgi:hypothetical protein
MDRIISYTNDAIYKYVQCGTCEQSPVVLPITRHNCTYCVKCWVSAVRDVADSNDSTENFYDLVPMCLTSADIDVYKFYSLFTRGVLKQTTNKAELTGKQIVVVTDLYYSEKNVTTRQTLIGDCLLQNDTSFTISDGFMLDRTDRDKIKFYPITPRVRTYTFKDTDVLYFVESST